MGCCRAIPDLGISGILETIEKAMRKYVPSEWGIAPRLKVSKLTREHLRQIITAFINTGEGEHAAPFYLQGRGTINLLVLAMLSQVAADRQNIVFAMEEPETAIPSLRAEKNRSRSTQPRDPIPVHFSLSLRTGRIQHDRRWRF